MDAVDAVDAVDVEDEEDVEDVDAEGVELTNAVDAAVVEGPGPANPAVWVAMKTKFPT